MKLINSSPGFLHVADAKLPELHLEGQQIGDRPYCHLSKLTSQTKLVIASFPAAGNLNLPPLDSVVELVLFNVIGLKETLMSGSLTSLQKLHWEDCEIKWRGYESDSDDLVEWEDYTEGRAEYEYELREAATALQYLPQLSQISGNGILVDHYLAHSLSEWELTDVSSGAMGLPHYERNIKVWNKTCS